jgi:hypothetical protein
MNCAEFEKGLVDLMAGETVVERNRDLRRLREHSRDCNDCRGAGELLSWLELPQEQRDPAEEPGSEYWAGFNRRLAGRIEREGSPRRFRSAAWVAAAALVLLLVAPRLWKSGPAPGGVDSEREIEIPMPEALVEILSDSSNDELLQTLPWSTGVPSGDEPALGEPVGGRLDGWLPDAAGLDEEGQRQLLEWLRAQTQGVSS